MRPSTLSSRLPTRYFRVAPLMVVLLLDFGILEDILENPPPFYAFADVRTLDVFGLSAGANNHNALDDCMNQVKYVAEVCKVAREGMSVLRDANAGS